MYLMIQQMELCINKAESDFRVSATPRLVSTFIVCRHVQDVDCVDVERRQAKRPSADTCRVDERQTGTTNFEMERASIYLKVLINGPMPLFCLEGVQQTIHEGVQNFGGSFWPGVTVLYKVFCAPVEKNMSRFIREWHQRLP